MRIILLISAFLLTSCIGQKFDNTNKKPPEPAPSPSLSIKTFSTKDLDGFSKECYVSSEYPNHRINLIINNKGVVAGAIFAKDSLQSSDCAKHAYRWDGDQYHYIPFDNNINCDDGLSCNLIVSGNSNNNVLIGMINDKSSTEYSVGKAFYYDDKFHILQDYDAEYFSLPYIHASANGKYLISDFVNYWYNGFVYDLDLHKKYDLPKHPRVQFAYEISDDGITIGDTIEDMKTHAPVPIICHLNNCRALKEFNDEAKIRITGVLSTLSANGLYIYGIKNDSTSYINGVNTIFMINPINNNVEFIDTPLLLQHCDFTLSSATDDGSVLVDIKNNDTDTYYLYSIQEHHLYKIQDLLDMLKINSDNKIEMTLSPDGRFLLLDHSKYHNNGVIATRIEFSTNIRDFVTKYLKYLV